LANAALRVGHQLVGRRIDALHASDENEITRPCSDAPGAFGLDGAGGPERANAIGRDRLGEGRSCDQGKEEQQCGSVRHRHSRLNLSCAPQVRYQIFNERQ
jgi:hypothetical protein